MSHRALVAVPDSASGPEKTYDLYFSRNGADSLILKPLLENHLQYHGDLESPPQIKSQAQHLLESFDLEEEHSLEGDLIDPTPTASEVSLSALGGHVDYVFHEAVFVQQDGHFDVYYPVFLKPDVLGPLREYATIYAWRGAGRPQSPDEVLENLDAQKAEFILTGTDLEAIYQEGGGTAQPQKELLEVALMGLLQNMYSIVSSHESETGAITQLWIRDWVIACEFDTVEFSLRSPVGHGVLVEIPTESHTHDELVSVHQQTVRTANRLLLQNSEQLRVDSPEIGEEEVSQTGQLLSQVLKTFGYDTSPLSPPPFRAVINDVLDD